MWLLGRKQSANHCPTPWMNFENDMPRKSCPESLWVSQTGFPFHRSKHESIIAQGCNGAGTRGKGVPTPFSSCVLK